MVGDLHCHTRFSDGSMSVEDLVRHAKRVGLDYLAVTDHDTMAGVAQAVALGAELGVRVIPGAEVSCSDTQRRRKVHILCYRPDRPELLQPLFDRTLEERNRVGNKVLREVLRRYPVTEEHIRRILGVSQALYKVHIMHALLQLGYDCQIYGELYRSLFGKQGVCREPQKYVDVYDALETIRDSGAVAVLAHPLVYDSLELLEELAQRRLIQGVEVRHPSASEMDVQQLCQLAERYGLLKTGGTDFHGGYASRPRPLGTCVSGEEWIAALLDAKQQPKG